jgi:hypothetical protein
MNPGMLVLTAAALIFAGCGSTIPNRMLVGERFPSVTGTSLSGVSTRVPETFAGTKVILVLGYVQETQFDIDRWSIGFFTADLPLPPVVELPTIGGLIPTLLRGTIDSGMRKGIPSDSWKDVVTVYGSDGRRLIEWTGNENPRNARILLLNEQGTVIWNHDGGFGLVPLRALLDTLRVTPAGTPLR